MRYDFRFVLGQLVLQRIPKTQNKEGSRNGSMDAKPGHVQADEITSVHGSGSKCLSLRVFRPPLDESCAQVFSCRRYPQVCPCEGLRKCRYACWLSRCVTCSRRLTDVHPRICSRGRQCFGPSYHASADYTFGHSERRRSCVIGGRRSCYTEKRSW